MRRRRPRDDALQVPAGLRCRPSGLTVRDWRDLAIRLLILCCLALLAIVWSR
jgi:hypothetical protein